MTLANMTNSRVVSRAVPGAGLIMRNTCLISGRAKRAMHKPIHVLAVGRVVLETGEAVVAIIIREIRPPANPRKCTPEQAEFRVCEYGRIPSRRTHCVLNEFPRPCLIPFPPTILEVQTIMKTNLSFSTPAEVETECLVAIVLDKAEKGKGEKDKPQLSIETSDAAVKDAAADVISGGEVTGKTFEATLLHHPAKLKAKRLLLLGGGKAKSFSAFELRRLAGAAVRTLKSRGLAQLRYPRARSRIENGRLGQGHRGRRIRRELRSGLLQERSQGSEDRRTHRGCPRRSSQTAAGDGRCPHRR